MFEFKLPDVGEGVHEGEVVRWLVKEGDRVRADQDIVEVMTDKATVMISSPVAGTVRKLRAKEGEVVRVGDVIVAIDETGSAAPQKPAAREVKAPAREAAQPEPPAKEDKTLFDLPTTLDPGQPAARARKAPARPAQPAATGPRALALPKTRKLAQELGVDLAALRGTGGHGQVTDADVRAAGGAPSRPAAAPTRAAVAPGKVERVPLRGLRRRIAENMARSTRTAAHYTYVVEVNADPLVRLREDLKPLARERGVTLSFLPLLAKAYAIAVRDHPRVNSTFDDEKQELVIHPVANVGIAVSTEQGLVVPVVRGVAERSVWDLAAAVEDLAQRGRAGKLTIEDFRDGTFTITSLGKLGGFLATPVLNYPQVGIMGVHEIRDVPVVRDGKVVPGKVMNLSFTFDHRLIDGAEAAAFARDLVRRVEEPLRMILD